MTEHELKEYGPMRYPGGKDGMFQVYCTCGYSSGPYVTIAAAYKPARAHKKSKEEAAEKAAVEAITGAEWRAMTLRWLVGDYAYKPRPDLAQRLSEGSDEFVTLSYQELFEIVETVRINSKQR